MYLFGCAYKSNALDYPTVSAAVKAFLLSREVSVPARPDLFARALTIIVLMDYDILYPNFGNLN